MIKKICPFQYLVQNAFAMRLVVIFVVFNIASCSPSNRKHESKMYDSSGRSLMNFVNLLVRCV
jgi:hypothetical protein